jgi:hypothetical protein
MGRPLIEIDPEEVRKLAQLGCKNDEIADYFECSAQTIESRFQPQLDKGRSELKLSLRRMQIQAAQRGNIAMMIWLGKQLLGQVERTQIDIAKIPEEVFLEEAKRRLEEQGKLSSGLKEPGDIEITPSEDSQTPIPVKPIPI